jgi:Tn3 transposase DDE domain
MLQRDGNPTPLGEAIASYGRIFKSLHILVYIDDDTYRRDIKGVRNSRKAATRSPPPSFTARKGELYERYHKGMEDQLGALGLVLNCIALWDTRYMNAALDELRAEGRTVLYTDVARLSPFVPITSTSSASTRSCCPSSRPLCGCYATPKTMTAIERRAIPAVACG